MKDSRRLGGKATGAHFLMMENWRTARLIPLPSGERPLIQDDFRLIATCRLIPTKTRLFVDEIAGRGSMLRLSTPRIRGKWFDGSPRSVVIETATPGRGWYPHHLLESAAEGRFGSVADFGRNACNIGVVTAQEP